MTPAQIPNPSRGPYTAEGSLHAVAALLVGRWGPPNSFLAPCHPADVAREARLVTYAGVI